MMKAMKMMNRPSALMKTTSLLRCLQFHRAQRFTILVKRSDSSRRGITLLLVILIISSLLSISLGIFDVVLGEFRISGEITNSFIALYAADLGIDKTLYDDRVGDSPCKGKGTCSYESTVTLTNGACINIKFSRTGKDTTIISTGEYRCSSPNLSVKRAFEANYTVKEGKKK